MKKSMKITLHLFLIFLLAGCYDRRNEIAMKLLYSPQDEFKKSSPALTGALIGKFPVGSYFIDLKKFSDSFGGDCKKPERWANIKKEDEYNLVCTIHEDGGFCFVHNLYINIKLDGDRISDIRAQQDSFGC